MKIKILIMALLLVVFQLCGCSSDDSTPSNNNVIMFLGTTNSANGGCNIQSDDGLDISCVYSAFYQKDGLSYTIAVSHEGACKSATFNLRDNLNQPSHAYFILQIASNGVATDTYLGFSGTVDLVDTGNNSSLKFKGTVVHNVSGKEEAIEGFVECAL